MKNSIPFRYRCSGGPSRESGVALIMALICLFVMSALAVGVLYSTQSEVWTNANYRAATQSRYMAEAGAQQALDYLQNLNLANTVPIASDAKFTTANFSYTTGMPVLYPGTCTSVTPPPPAYSGTACRPVIMATAGISSKYADTQAAIDTALGTTYDSAFQTAFAAATTQTPYQGLTNCSGSSCPQYSVAVQLLTAALDSSTGTWRTRWKIVSEGTMNTLGGSSTSGGKAMVQVVEIVDNVMVTSSSSSSSPTYAAGVAATGTGCNSIVMSGGQYTNSYVGATQAGNTSPTLANTGGNVATNGNIKITNGAYIVGNVYSPFYNVGTTGTYGISGGPSGLNGSAACSTSTGGTEYAVNEDNSGSGVGCTSESASSCSQKTYPLTTAMTSYATPVMPTVTANVTTPTSSSSGTWYGLLGGGSGGGNGCAVTVAPSGGTVTSTGFVSPANFGNVTIGSCAVVTLQAGVYNMNSLTIANGGQIILPSSGSVVINLLTASGDSSVTDALNVNGGTVANNGGNPGNFTIVYAGTKPVNLDAGENMFATIYAPNAPLAVSGNAGLYGAVVANTATFSGSGHVIYDSSLAGQSMNVSTGSAASIPGALHVDEFSWSAF